MSVLDLRDAYHTLPLVEESQKYCGLTPYYGSPTYVYLRMGMGMSCSPALWQQFVHIIWEQLPNKECYKIIMDDICRAIKARVMAICKTCLHVGLFQRRYNGTYMQARGH